MCEMLLRGQLQVNDDSFLGRSDRVTGKEGGRVPGCLIDDPQIVGCHDLGTGDLVNEVAIGCIENHLVARHQLIEISKRLGVACAMPGNDCVAKLSRHCSAGPVSGPPVEGGQADALVQRLGHVDLRNRNGAQIDFWFGDTGFGRRLGNG